MLTVITPYKQPAPSVTPMYLDPAWCPSVGYSNGNLSAHVTYLTGARANLGKMDNIRQFEVKLNNYNQQSGFIGVGTVSAISSSSPSNSPNTYILDTYGMIFRADTAFNSASAWGEPTPINTIVGVVLDFNTNTIRFYKNGVLKYSYPSLPSGTLLYPLIYPGGGTSTWLDATFNFGATAFIYPVVNTIPYNN